MNEIEGKAFAFTGSLDFPRRELQAELESRGGIYHPRVTRTTDYLVIGRVLSHQGENGQTKKMATAQRYREQGYPVRTIEPAEFVLMLIDSRVMLQVC